MFAIINWRDFSEEGPEDVLGLDAFDLRYMVSCKESGSVVITNYVSWHEWSRRGVEYWAQFPEKPRKPDESVWLGTNEPLKENANYVE